LICAHFATKGAWALPERWHVRADWQGRTRRIVCTASNTLMMRGDAMASTETKSVMQKDDATSTPDGSRVVTAVFVGAILGGVWGWLYFTPRGNTVRDRVDPAVDRIVDALEKVQSLRSVVKSLAVLVLAIGLVIR
jgi:hypothetical protein